MKQCHCTKKIKINSQETQPVVARRLQTCKHHQSPVDEVGCVSKSVPLGLPEVSQTSPLPHLFGCLPQMVGLGGSRAPLILPCLCLELRHGSLCRSGREISTAALHRVMPQCFAWIAGVFSDTPLSDCPLLASFYLGCWKVLIVIWPKSCHDKTNNAHHIYVQNSRGVKTKFVFKQIKVISFYVNVPFITKAPPPCLFVSMTSTRRCSFEQAQNSYLSNVLIIKPL